MVPSLLYHHGIVPMAHLAGLSPQLGNPRPQESPESRSSASFPMRTGSRAATGRRVYRYRSTEAPVGRTASDLRRSPPEPSLLTSPPNTWWVRETLEEQTGAKVTRKTLLQRFILTNEATMSYDITCSNNFVG